MEYIAHFRLESGKLLIQTIKEHTDNVLRYSINNFNQLNLNSFISLIAILHDIGKYSDDFQSYIKTAISETQKGSYDNRIKTAEKKDHGVYGAYYIFSKYGNCAGVQKLVADIMTILICYHHGGLPDCTSGHIIPIVESVLL